MSRVFKVDYIPDPDRGRPLWNAKIFVGVANQDPTIPSNQIQLTGDIGFPVGQSIPVPQPVRTNAGGITVYNNSPLDLNAPGQSYAIQIFDRNDNLIYNFPQVDGSVVLDTTSQEEVTGLTIFPEVGEAVIGQTIPAGTDGLRSILNGKSTLFSIIPPVATTGSISALTINADGTGLLTVNGTDVYDLKQFNMITIPHDGDEQSLGGSIVPESPQQVINGGDDLTGASFVRLQGGDFSEITLFPFIRENLVEGPLTGTFVSANLTTRPYTLTTSTETVYLLDIEEWNKPYIARPITAMWCVGDDSTDNFEQMTAISRFIGGSWFAPAGIYFSSGTINVKRLMGLSGEYSQGAGIPFLTQFKFAAGVVGFFVHRGNTNADDTGVPFIEAVSTGFGAGSVFKNLWIYEENQSSLPAIGAKHGFWYKGRVDIENIRVTNFVGSGIYGHATQGSGDPETEGNANSTRIKGAACYNNGVHGFLTLGADVNACSFDSIQCYQNGGYGIFEGSFLGNSYNQINVGNNNANNWDGLGVNIGLGVSNPNNRSTFTNPYFENGSVYSEDRVLFLGGQFTVPLLPYPGGNTNPGARIFSTAGVARTLLGFETASATTSNGTTNATLGTEANSGTILKATNTDFTTTYRLQMPNFDDIQERADNNTSRIWSVKTGGNTVVTFGRTAAQPYKTFFPTEFFVGSGSRGAAIKKSNGAPPSSGLAARGDDVFNDNSSAIGQPVGWKCITTGTNGVDAVYGVRGLIS